MSSGNTGKPTLLTAPDLRDALSERLSEAGVVAVFSAFLAEEAGKWLLSSRAGKPISRILVRGLPGDFLAGACSFSALRRFVEHGVPVKFSSGFHGKIFVLDEVGFVGSANLTAKGLALNMNPNVELATEIELSRENSLLLENIWSQGVTVNEDNLKAYENFVAEIGKPADSCSAEMQTLPISIFTEIRDLYCSDFPGNSDDADGTWAVYSSLSVKPAYLWLLKTVREAGEAGCSFGFLSSQLHTVIFDDPTPYRSTVKQLLRNLLNIVEEYDSKTLLVTRPRYTQVVTLRRP